MRIIYVGTSFIGGTCLQRMQAFKDLGHDIIHIDTKPQDIRSTEKRLTYKIRRKLFGLSDLADVNKKILSLIKKSTYQILWIDKGLTVRAETLGTIQELSPNTVIAGYSPDDMLNTENQSRQFIEGLRFYDVYFTTKSYNVQELKDLGCRKVVFIENAYDPSTHRPVAVVGKERLILGGSVGFMGSYERERAEAILYLAKNDISVRVWGKGWDKRLRGSHPNLKIEGRALWKDDYARALSSFDINLAFLRKCNRDLQTTRSIEIPACGSFMLAERTKEHLKLFEEGKEAEFFDTKEELLAKIKYYSEHEKERRDIAIAGYKRCITGGYSNRERLEKVLKLLYKH